MLKQRDYRFKSQDIKWYSGTVESSGFTPFKGQMGINKKKGQGLALLLKQ